MCGFVCTYTVHAFVQYISCVVYMYLLRGVFNLCVCMSVVTCLNVCTLSVCVHRVCVVIALMSVFLYTYCTLI